ncbi:MULTISPECIES: GNAT family N-acetyltransferase [Hyphobacterium]|uniref:GNAT family N-acetyltransferase n=1 Tax=Hyphobacterium vulgare TaxID=1736751 RepID=A0ABV7A0S6_9PROT
MRLGNERDHDALGEVMFDAVRNGPSPYAEAQRAAWVPAPRSGQAWRERLSSQTIILDEKNGEIRGFMTLRSDGYVDFAYIRPGCRGDGVFRKLFDEVRRIAVARGEKRLWVHASLMAQPAFTAMGFRIIRRETVAIGDEALDRFEMEMMLTGD